MKKLGEIKKKSPFQVPENYFSEVNRKIIAAAAEHEPGSRKAGISAKLKAILKIAAFISGFILVSYFLLRSFQPINLKEPEPAISLQEFSESYLNEIDMRTLEEIGAKSLLSDEVPELGQSEIIDYLLMDDIKINEIYEEL